MHPEDIKAALRKKWGTVKAFEEKEGGNVREVGSKYASFRVIGFEGVAPK